MNDPQYFEAARALGERAVREGGEETSARLHFLFELATSRPPTEDEQSVLNALFEDLYAEFSADGGRAEKTITVGDLGPVEDIADDELAAWTMVANLILNLDEFLTKG
jgi:hypothetical protein